MDDKTFSVIERIAAEHSSKKFGYLTENDLKNEIWVICLEKLEDYSAESGELEHFLRVCVKNRLVNRFKEITKSVRSPCPRCPFFKEGQTPDCGKFGEEKGLCGKWRNYQLSIESRNSLLNASEPQEERYIDTSALGKMASSEIKDLVLSKIEQKYKHDLNKLVSGQKLSKQKAKKLKVAILAILEAEGVA